MTVVDALPFMVKCRLTRMPSQPFMSAIYSNPIILKPHSRDSKNRPNNSSESNVSLQFIMKCALTRMPNQPFILTLYSNLIVETRKDGQAARTQIQLAGKNNPTLIERYFIYVSQETAKKLKSESGGLDLVG